MRDLFNEYSQYVLIGGIGTIVIIGAVLFGGVFGSELGQDNPTPDKITMADIPQEYRDTIVTQENQSVSTTYYGNEESGVELDRNWSSHGSYQSFNPDNETHLVELTQYPTSNVTLSQLNNAWELYYQTYTTAERNGWFDIENARDDNYYRFDTLHYIDVAELHSEDDLNPRKPEALLYRSQEITTETGENKTVKRLVGVMYLQDSFDHGQQVGGPLTAWHYHIKPSRSCPGEIETNSILDSEVPNHVRPNASPNELLPNGEELLKNAYECDVEKQHSMEMMHVWFEKRPAGPFASQMFSKREAPKKYDRMNKTEFVGYTLDRYQNVQSNMTINTRK